MVDNIELWHKYKKENSEQARQQLIIKYLNLVKYQAGRINMIVPDYVEKEDLESYGILGLMDAIEKFNPDSGNKFNSYAQYRIRGAIIDQLRKLDWLPHTIRKKARIVKNKVEEIKNKSGHEPTIDELAAELEMSKEELKKLYSKLHESDWVSLYSELGGRQVYEFLPESGKHSPEKIYQKQQIVNILADSIQKLTEDEKLVVTLYYYEELTQVEIAEIMDLSPARISQIHKKAIFRLRGFLGRKKGEFV